MNISKWYSQCNSGDEAYRCLLTSINSKISDLDELKYQCQDWIGRGKMERINSCLELFNVLEERDKICPGDVDFLITILNNIRRKDLVKMVHEYKQYWMVAQPQLDQWSWKHMEFNVGASSSSNDKAFSGFRSDVKQDSGVSRGSPDRPPTSALPFQGDVAQTSAATHADTMGPASIASMCDYLSRHLAHNWQATMRRLNVPEDIISAAMYNWPNNLRRQIVETLDYWKDYGTNVSVATMITALRQSGRNDLGDYLTAMFNHMP